MSDFDKIVSGIFALFIGGVLFIGALPTMLIATGQNPIVAYLIGVVCFGAVFVSFLRLTTG
jgi:hypothetical protein